MTTENAGWLVWDGSDYVAKEKPQTPQAETPHATPPDYVYVLLGNYNGHWTYMSGIVDTRLPEHIAMRLAQYEADARGREVRVYDSRYGVTLRTMKPNAHITVTSAPGPSPAAQSPQPAQAQPQPAQQPPQQQQQSLPGVTP